MPTLDYLYEMSTRVRRDILEMIYYSEDGHPAPSLSAADIITALYFEVMNIAPEDPAWTDRDRFILSKGHACPALYAALSLKGYFPRTEYPTLRRLNSILQGHPDMRKTPGIDMTTGSLGNGLAAGLGIALSGRLEKKSFRTYVLCGDGELGEGVVWEAAQTIVKYRLNTVTLIVDNNSLQSGGDIVTVGGIINIPEKFTAFGWRVKVIDGHDMGEIVEALNEATAYESGPTCIVARTVKGKGVTFMERNNAWHKKALKEADFNLAMEGLSKYEHRKNSQHAHSRN